MMSLSHHSTAVGTLVRREICSSCGIYQEEIPKSLLVDLYNYGEMYNPMPKADPVSPEAITQNGCILRIKRAMPKPS